MEIDLTSLEITDTQLSGDAEGGEVARHPGSLKPVRVKEAPRPKVKPDGNPLNNAPFRDVNGKYRTRSLFLEHINVDLDPIYQPRFCLSEWDQELSPTSMYYNAYPNHTIPSLRRLYLEATDPSEYNFAQTVLASDRHWRILLEAEWFKPYVQEWREALVRKITSIAVANLIRISGSMDEAKALQAAKWLAEGSYQGSEAKGRPKAASVAQETKIQVQVRDQLQEDAERLGINLKSPTQGTA